MTAFDFLEAADGTPLTKRFVKHKGKLEVEPYPYVKNVNSARETVTSIEELLPILESRAAGGWCMLKGLLDRDLSNESRAGRTTAEAFTQWVLLDLDFEEGWNSVDSFIEALNPEWSDVSYIFQHSASAGIKYKPGLRGHLWLLLDRPISPELLKTWLKERNLSLFKDGGLELTANGHSIKWPLDITTCQNDKLIYIAPPQCVGFDDPLAGQRFRLVTKDRGFAPAPKPSQPAAAVNDKISQVVIDLRAKNGLPKANSKFRERGALNILVNPDEAVVTGVREARGFVYLNLNGGDSWAYYFPKDKPDLLYNFKGEPVVRLRDIAPDFYASYVERLASSRFGGIDVKPFVFRDPMTDVYNTVVYDPKEQEIVHFGPANSKDRMKDFLAQFGKELPDPIPDWTVEFNPTTFKIIDPKQRWVNTFKPTQYLKKASGLTVATEPPPVISKIIASICAEDEDAYDHFLNWLACIFQYRVKTETSWVFHGVSGTGKGLLLDKVLVPLFGREHVTIWSTQQLEEQYNAGLERSLILWLDELRVGDARSPDLVMNKLKSFVTEPVLPIRVMRQDTRNINSYFNTIIASNHLDMLMLSHHDRRFNVAPPQFQPLQITQAEVDAIADELPMMASFLYNKKANRDHARAVLKNEAREQLIEASTTSVEQFFNNVANGNLEWFIEFAQSDPPLDNILIYQRFEQALERIVRRTMDAKNINADYSMCITRDELMAIYQYVVGTHAMSKAKFSRLCSIHKMRMTSTRVDGRPQRAVLVTPRIHFDNAKRFLTMIQSRGSRRLAEEFGNAGKSLD